MLGDELSFDELPGWADDDHAAALSAFYKNAKFFREKLPKTRALGVSAKALGEIGHWLFHLDEGILGDEARQFFESHFVPRKICPSKDLTKSGFVTGYYEPEVEGSTAQTSKFQTPLMRPPPNLVRLGDVPADHIPSDWDHSVRFAKQTQGRAIEPFFDREAISSGALDGQGLEIVYLDPIDAFFIHIQGSARIRLETGESIRVSYAAKSGHPYTAIGRVLIDWGEIKQEDMSMETIRSWLSSHPDRQNEVFFHNHSYIFFDEVRGLNDGDGPIGAAGVSLSSLRSLAVDRKLHTFGTPIFLDVAFEAPFRKLMVAQDTGSAIVGPARGDIYFGSGPEAEKIAGTVQHAADFYLLWPKHQPK